LGGKKVFTEHGIFKKSFYRAWKFSKKFLQSMEIRASPLHRHTLQGVKNAKPKLSPERSGQGRE
jgi:hypothetical protein